MTSIETQILHADLDLDCPGCGFTVWVRSSEVVAQCTVICPCCRVRVRLVNDRGSVTTAARNIEAAARNLFKGQ